MIRGRPQVYSVDERPCLELWQLLSESTLFNLTMVRFSRVRRLSAQWPISVWKGNLEMERGRYWKKWDRDWQSRLLKELLMESLPISGNLLRHSRAPRKPKNIPIQQRYTCITYIHKYYSHASPWMMCHSIVFLSSRRGLIHLTCQNVPRLWLLLASKYISVPQDGLSVCESSQYASDNLSHTS